MASDSDKARRAVAVFQSQTGLSDHAWETASGVGAGTLRKWRADPVRSMNMRTYEKLAEGARSKGIPVTVAQLRGDAPYPGPRDASEESSLPPSNASRAPEGTEVPPYRSEMPRDVPVYGTVVGGSGQHLFDFEMNGNVVDFVRRPPRLRGRSDVFAAYVQGDSMLYWREPGQLVYVERARPPRPMDYVLVELKPVDTDGVRPALIKRLIGLTPTKLKLRQYNPFKEIEIDLAAVLHLYRIMDWDELMGV